MPRWSINLDLPKKEKDEILKIYDDNGIKYSKRLLMLVRSDVEKLEDLKK